MSGKKHPRASPHALREFKPGARKAGAFQIFQVSHLSLPRHRLIPALVQNTLQSRIAAEFIKR
jgi:hypothetical protein